MVLLILVLRFPVPCVGRLHSSPCFRLHPCHGHLLHLRVVIWHITAVPVLILAVCHVLKNAEVILMNYSTFGFAELNSLSTEMNKFTVIAFWCNSGTFLHVSSKLVQ